MSAIIKSAAANAVVREIPMPQPALVEETRAEERCERRIAELEARIATLTREATDLRADAKAAFVRGEEEGRRAGQRQAEDREQERLAALAQAIANARKELSEALGATERLAALLAKSCLDKLFAEDGENGARVCALLRVQMGRIERQQLIAVEVSPDDFSDEALGQLRAVLANDAVTIRRNPDLPTGSCRLQPRLGEIDIGLGTQWRAIAGLLERLAEGEGP
jgi:type III secretion protein L